MAVSDAHVFPSFLIPLLTQISFQSHQLLFSHASAEVRGENTPERNFNRVSNSQPPGHESDATEPPGRGKSNLKCQIMSDTTDRLTLYSPELSAYIYGL